MELNSLRLAGLVLSLWDASIDEGVSFETKLKSVHASGLPSIVSGRLILSTSRAGHSVSFDATGLTPGDVFDAITKLRLGYVSRTARLISAGVELPELPEDSTKPNDRDEQIKNELLAEAQHPATEYRSDYTLARGGYAFA